MSVTRRTVRGEKGERPGRNAHVTHCILYLGLCHHKNERFWRCVLGDGWVNFNKTWPVRWREVRGGRGREGEEGSEREGEEGGERREREGGR